MRRVLICLLVLLPASLAWLSCGSSAPSSPQYRALISNFVTAGTTASGVYALDALNDVRGSLAPLSTGNTPGPMVVTPNLAYTLVFSGNGLPSSDNVFSLVNNSTLQVNTHLTLPGMTDSFIVSPDSSTAYVAVPTAQVTGQSPGLVEVVSISGGAFSGQAAVPAVHYLAINNGGNRVLGFSDNSDSIAVITPSNIGIGNAVTYVSGFDRPVAAFFTSDDSTAYVINCGPECGGTQASVQILDMTTGTAGAAVNVPASTVALVSGGTMYLAGTPQPAPPCTGEVTQATTCGLLTIFNLSSMTVTGSPIVITDGYHDRMALGANGQIYIGSHTCTEIIPPVPPPAGAEIRGCLSIYNTLSSAVGSVQPGGVLIPPQNGDVTSLEPIANRHVVYVIQNGSLRIYDDTIDALEYNPHNPNNPGQISGLVGQFVDVKTINF